METPEYVICLNCETPCYTFEWKNGDVYEAMCPACGDDDPDEFMTEEEYDGMLSSGHH